MNIFTFVVKAQGDLAAVRKDLSARPVEGVDGEATEEAIYAILAKYGITAEEVKLWGTGMQTCEFLWSE